MNSTHKKLKAFAQTMIIVTVLGACLPSLSQDKKYLQRSVKQAKPVRVDITSETATYTPLFGVGDADSEMVHGVNRFGLITVEPNGKSKAIHHRNIEMICYVLSGTGLWQADTERLPISKDDFFYIPADTEYGFSNPRESTLDILMMGYTLPDSLLQGSHTKVQIASASEVPFKVLGHHGPTTQFQLLMGTTESKRDRLSVAHQANSLFVMDFAPGGTNIPHRHEFEEEIYYVLRGYGDMVAGESKEGIEMRYPAIAGDAFFIPRNTLVGFYSGAQPGEDHVRILAIRSKYSGLGKKGR